MGCRPALYVEFAESGLFSPWQGENVFVLCRNIDLESSKEWLLANKALPVKADYSSYTSYVPYARLKSKPSHKKRKSGEALSEKF